MGAKFPSASSPWLERLKKQSQKCGHCTVTQGGGVVPGSFQMIPSPYDSRLKRPIQLHYIRNNFVCECHTSWKIIARKMHGAIFDVHL